MMLCPMATHAHTRRPRRPWSLHDRAPSTLAPAQAIVLLLGALPAAGAPVAGRRFLLARRRLRALPLPGAGFSWPGAGSTSRALPSPGAGFRGRSRCRAPVSLGPAPASLTRCEPGGVVRRETDVNKIVGRRRPPGAPAAGRRGRRRLHALAAAAQALSRAIPDLPSRRS